MLTRITRRAGTLVTAIAVLTGGATLFGSPATADPNQDDQFIALLDEEQISALENVPTLIVVAHSVCRALDRGVPVDEIVDALRNNMYQMTPNTRLQPRRVTTTVTRFVDVSVRSYCPYDQAKIASPMASRTPGSNQPPHRPAIFTRNAVNSAASDVISIPARWQEPTASLIGAVPSGDVTPTNPPQVPAPPPPIAQIPTPPQAITARPPKQPPPSAQQPPPPQQVQPPPQQVPPPPEQVEPPDAAPQPGGPAGSGGPGGAGSGGPGGGADGPAAPSPSPVMPPGFIRLAP